MTSFAPIHSSELNVFVFAGVDLSSGLGKDDYIEFTPNSPLTAVGNDSGSKERYISALADKSGTLVLTLASQSPTNLKLNGIVSASRKDGNKPVIGDFYIQRGGTLFLYEAKGCHLMERPTQTISTSMSESTQTWTFDVAEMTEVDINDVDLDIDLKASIKGDIGISVELSITL